MRAEEVRDLLLPGLADPVLRSYEFDMQVFGRALRIVAFRPGRRTVERFIPEAAIVDDSWKMMFLPLVAEMKLELDGGP